MTLFYALTPTCGRWAARHYAAYGNSALANNIRDLVAQYRDLLVYYMRLNQTLQVEAFVTGSS